MSYAKETRRSILVVIAVVSLLIVLKLVFGIISKSSALISDAVHSTTDLIVALASLIGLYFANRPPTKKFSYGYYKVENLTTLLISIVILGSSGELIYEGIKRLFETPVLVIPYVAMGVALFSSLSSLILGYYLRKVAKKTKSTTIEANAKDKLLDTLTSLIVFSSILASFFEVKYFEGIVTIVISLMAIKIGIEIGKESLFSLLDKSDVKLEQEVGEMINKTAGVINFARLRIRKSGSYYLGDCEIRVQKELSIDEAHEISEKVKAKILTEDLNIITFVVHVEPEQREERRIILPVFENQGLESVVFKQFGRAPKLLLVNVNIQSKSIGLIEEIKNPFLKQESHAGLAFTKLVLKKDINTLITKEIGEITFYKLKGEHIEVYRADCDNIKDCLEKLFHNKLETIQTPTKEKI